MKPIYLLSRCLYFVFGIGLSLLCRMHDVAAQDDPALGDFKLEVGQHVLFYVPFDHNTMPKLARGHIEPTEKTIDSYVPGRHNRKAVVIRKDSRVSYQAKDNINTRSGTVAFWVNLLDGSGNDEHARYFISIHGRRSTENNGWLTLYKRRTMLYVVMNDLSGGGLEHPPLAAVTIADWKQGQWHFVAYSWSKDLLTLHVDGEQLISRQPEAHSLLQGVVDITVGGWNSLVSGGEQLRSAIQDLVIFDRLMTTNEIKSLFVGGADYDRTAQLRPKSERPIVTVRRAAQTPELDGEIDAGAWAMATRFTGFVDNQRRMYADPQTHVSLTANHASLYIAFETPVAGRDAVAAAILPQGHVRPTIFIVRRSGDHSLPNGIEYTSRSSAGRWQVLMRVPFNILGAEEPDQGEIWQANFMRWSDAAGIKSSWVYQRRPSLTAVNTTELGQLRFDDAAPIIRVDHHGDPTQDRRATNSHYYLDEGSDEKLFLFTETISLDKKIRSVNTARPQPGEFTHLEVLPGTTATGRNRKGEYVQYGFVSQDFKRIFYRSEKLPIGQRSPVDIEMLSYERRQALRVTISTLSLPPDAIDTSILRVTLHHGNQVVDLITVRGLSAAIQEVDFSITGFVPGAEYLVSAELVDTDGESFAKDEQFLVYPDTSKWLHNTIGISAHVPAPFEPLEVDGKSVSCWGRTYTFETPTGLPSDIATHEVNILAGPVSLQLGDLAFEPLSGDIVSVGHDKVVYEVRSRAGQVEVLTRATVEYDGMIRFDLTLRPEKIVQIDRFVLDIPLKRPYARYLGYTIAKGRGTVPSHSYGLLPESGWRGSFYPFVWLGDEYRGLLWFAESAKGWRPSDRNRAIEIISEDQTVTLRLNLADAGLNLTRPITYTFGLQAAPVKPMPLQWRSFEKRMTRFRGTQQYFGYVPYAIAKFPDLMRKLVEKQKLITPYTLLNHVSTDLPEYNLFHDEWRYSEGAKTKSYIDRVDPNSKSWQNFIVWELAHALAMAPIHGLYYDHATPIPTTSLNHSAYLSEDGKVQPYWPIFGLREIAKRVYTHFRNSRGGDQTLFICHSSANGIVLPVLAFCDLSLEGEQVSYRLHSYIEQWPLDYMRMTLSGKPFGIPSIALPQLSKSGNNQYDHRTEQPTRELLALAFLHDMLILSAHWNFDVYRRYREIWFDFIGDDTDVEFLPYWDNSNYVSADTEDVRISIYRRPNRAMLVVFNFSENNIEPHVMIDLNRFGLKRDTVIYDALSKQRFTLDGMRTVMPLESRQLRLVIIRPMEGKRK